MSTAEETKEIQKDPPKLKKGPFKLINTWPNQNGYLKSISLSSDGKKLVSTTGENKFYISDRASGTLLKTVQFEGYQEYVVAVFFHRADTNRIFCSTFSNGLTEWDSEGNFVRSFEEISGDICSITYSADGSFIATGSGIGPIILWNVDSGKKIWKNKEEKTQTACLCFSPDGKVLASGHNDFNVKIWDRSDGSLIRQLKGHTNIVISIIFSNDGTKLASGGCSDNSVVRIWDTISWETIHILSHRDGIRCLSFFSEGKRLVSGSCDGSIRVWDVKSGKEVEQLAGHTKEVRCFYLVEDGAELISGACDSTIRFWERSEGPEITVGWCSLI